MAKQKQETKNETLLFNKWDSTAVEVRDPSLQGYINLEPIIIPRTGGRHEAKRFWKSKMHIIERLMNKLMTPGHKGKEHWWTSRQCTGKSQTNYKTVKKVLENLENKTQQNPLQVIATAVENSSPREEATNIEYGGTRYQKAVDISPQRRVDLALRWITQTAYAKSVNNKKSIVQTLSDEILKAYKNDPESAAVKKKNETERHADSSR